MNVPPEHVEAHVAAYITDYSPKSHAVHLNAKLRSRLVKILPLASALALLASTPGMMSLDEAVAAAEREPQPQAAAYSCVRSAIPVPNGETIETPWRRRPDHDRRRGLHEREQLDEQGDGARAELNLRQRAGQRNRDDRDNANQLGRHLPNRGARARRASRRRRPEPREPGASSTASSSRTPRRRLPSSHARRSPRLSLCAGGGRTCR